MGNIVLRRFWPGDQRIVDVSVEQIESITGGMTLTRINLRAETHTFIPKICLLNAVPAHFL